MKFINLTFSFARRTILRQIQQTLTWLNLEVKVIRLSLTTSKPNAQQAVWRKRGCCLVGHLAGF